MVSWYGMPKKKKGGRHAKRQKKKFKTRPA
jgi:hypothetical protein